MTDWHGGAHSNTPATQELEILTLSQRPLLEIQLETDIQSFIKEILFSAYHETFKGFPNLFLIDTTPVDATVEVFTADLFIEEISVTRFPSDKVQKFIDQPSFWSIYTKAKGSLIGNVESRCSLIIRNIGGRLPTLVQIVDIAPLMNTYILPK